MENHPKQLAKAVASSSEHLGLNPNLDVTADDGEFNEFGFHSNGSKYGPDGFNSEGRDQNGRDRGGFDLFGIHENGTGYGPDGFNRQGFNRNGFDESGKYRSGQNILFTRDE